MTQEHLFDAFDLVTSYRSASIPPHVSASEIMGSWTENIGYPLIIVSRCYHHGEVTIKQVEKNSFQLFHLHPIIHNIEIVFQRSFLHNLHLDWLLIGKSS